MPLATAAGNMYLPHAKDIPCLHPQIAQIQSPLNHPGHHKWRVDLSLWSKSPRKTIVCVCMYQIDATTVSKWVNMACHRACVWRWGNHNKVKAAPGDFPTSLAFNMAMWRHHPQFTWYTIQHCHIEQYIILNMSFHTIIKAMHIEDHSISCLFLTCGLFDKSIFISMLISIYLFGLSVIPKWTSFLPIHVIWMFTDVC